MTAASLGLPDPTTSPAFYQGVSIKRAAAWLIDTVMIAIVSALILPFTLFLGIFIFPLMMLVTGFFYRWFTLTSGSSTWGMRMMAIQIRDKDGMKLSSETALMHTLGFSISIVVAPLQLVSIAMMLLTARGQGLTDHLLGTTAINRPA
jgi:uncharacterized RDD family membrane protein YckC